MYFRGPAISVLFLSLIPSAVLSQTHGGGGRSSTPRPSSAGNPANTGLPIPSATPVTTADQEGRIEFRTQAVLIQVPIIVTDKSGNHIHGMMRENFHVLENGKEQKISGFEEVTPNAAKLPVVATQPGEFRNLTLTEQDPHIVTVIALDTVNTPFLDQATGRRELVKYLASNLSSGQVLAMMIITSHGLKIVQGLTGDPAQLLAALKKAGGELPAMHEVDLDAQADAAAGDISDLGSIPLDSDPTSAIDDFVQRGDAIYAQFQQQNAIETTMNAFLGIARSLSGIPGRKSLIWATGGFPFTISSPAAVPGGYLSGLYERAMDALAAAQISVYPVDVRGLVNNNPIGDASISRPRVGSALVRQMGNRAWLQQSTIDTLNEFAEMTGGKAFYNTNDLATSFQRAADDASSYYLASYYLDMRNDRAGWRQLKVKVDKKDTDVRARKGFFVTNATLHMEISRDTDMRYALTSPLEGTGVPLSMKWLPATRDGEKKKAGFLIHFPVDAVTIENHEGQRRFNFDVAAIAFTADGKNSKTANATSKTVTAAIPDAKMSPLREKGLTMEDSLELDPGQYVVRVVVRDNVTGRIGSVTAPLSVN